MATPDRVEALARGGRHSPHVFTDITLPLLDKPSPRYPEVKFCTVETETCA